MDDIILALSRHFRPKESLIGIRVKFFQVLQGRKSLEEYARAVEDLGRRAQLGSEMESWIKDKFIEGLENSKTFRCLVDLRPDTMTEAVTMAHEDQQLATRVVGIRDSDTTSSYKRPKENARQGGQYFGKRDEDKDDRGQRYKPRRRCGNCGFDCEDGNCLEKNAQCSSCRKVGHYRRQCRQKGSDMN